MTQVYKNGNDAISFVISRYNFLSRKINHDNVKMKLK